MEFSLEALNEAALELGKGVILYAVDNEGDPVEWDGTADIDLAHLGDTQGVIKFTSNEQLGTLKLPEVYGDAALRAYVTGADPVLTAPLFLATPSLRQLISPTRNGLIGSGSRTPVARWTLVVLPQALFYDETDPIPGNKADISFSGSAWTKKTYDQPEGRALTTDEERLLGLGIWMFSGYWERPPVTYEATVNDVVVNVEECTFHVLRSTAALLQGTLAIVGLPEDYDIDIAPTLS